MVWSNNISSNSATGIVKFQYCCEFSITSSAIRFCKLKKHPASRVRPLSSYLCFCCATIFFVALLVITKHEQVRWHFFFTIKIIRRAAAFPRSPIFTLRYTTKTTEWTLSLNQRLYNKRPCLNLLHLNLAHTKNFVRVNIFKSAFSVQKCSEQHSKPSSRYILYYWKNSFCSTVSGWLSPTSWVSSLQERIPHQGSGWYTARTCCMLYARTRHHGLKELHHTFTPDVNRIDRVKIDKQTSTHGREVLWKVIGMQENHIQDTKRYPSLGNPQQVRWVQ